jgi:hypothetical protein
MFGSAPADYVPTPAEQDMAARLCASVAQHAEAAALLANLPPVFDHVYVALVLPGKVRGYWTEGQPVEPVPGAYLDRDLATAAACLQLGDRPGTPAYVAVWRDGAAAVFEDFRHDHG